MNKQTFWAIIEESIKAVPGKTEEAARTRADWLINRLQSVSNMELILFEKIWRAYHRLLNKSDLLDIGNRLDSFGLSDDGWNDARNWMIVQGQAVVDHLVDDHTALVEYFPGKGQSIRAEMYVGMKAFELKGIPDDRRNPYWHHNYNLEKDCLEDLEKNPVDIPQQEVPVKAPESKQSPIEATIVISYMTHADRYFEALETDDEQSVAFNKGAMLAIEKLGLEISGVKGLKEKAHGQYFAQQLLKKLIELKAVDDPEPGECFRGLSHGEIEAEMSKLLTDLLVETK